MTGEDRERRAQELMAGVTPDWFEHCGQKDKNVFLE